jgi:murein DD-endopeptidase MepM/ murein hydrolase activator NlpD
MSAKSQLGLFSLIIAIIASLLSSCSPSQGIWYPLAQPGQVTQGFHAGHTGVDIWTPYGMQVRSVSKGTVTFADWYYGYGKYVCVTKDSGFKSCYAHLSSILTRVGAKVTPGQTIGLVGATGDATGPHLHFEIYRFGRAVDPLPYLPAR